MLKNINELINKYKEEAVKLTSDLVAFESVLDEFNPDSDAPFGIENKKALELKQTYSNSWIPMQFSNFDNKKAHIKTATEILNDTENKVGKTSNSCSIHESVTIFKNLGIPKNKLIFGI